MGKMPAITLDQMGKIKLMNRTDTKFLTNKAGLLRVLQMAENDYFAQEIEGKRIARYRTTYWDFDDYQFYVMHHNGHKPRMKVRVRTYEDSHGLTYLEIKRKDNHGKTKKKRTEVKSQTEIIESGGDAYLMEHTGIPLSDLHPCLQNYFKRITLVNKGKTERLTIDFDIDFTNFDTEAQANSGDLVIIELKRDGLVYSPIMDILNQLRIRPHGYSKYVIGSFMTNPGLKRNLLKRKYAEIQKILNK
ncbi:MAG: polyphosphate polymerase domain-containing protein [Bacteroidaceae bacterium]|nr:polyphosphate polymerase domain-containing protein [Bacteroidaceae bacterium]